MRAHIVFAHPSRESFSAEVLQAFSRGLDEAHHTWTVSDLYAMGFQTDMDELQYRREVSLDPVGEIPGDVRAEQERVDAADVLVFVYPVWWSDGPAKLKGWFDRVFTRGWAYCYAADGERSTRIKARRALVICPAGHTVEHLDETGIAAAMRTIMLEDRLSNAGLTDGRMEFLGGMMPGDDTWRAANLRRAYELGRDLGAG
jgi:NAD(P)H dehydrogenase (quinone)